MSEIITDLVWYPPEFPAKGRLPTQASLIGEHCYKQDSQEHAYRQELCLAAGRRVAPPCCKTLHISLFFDGTGNNLNNDLFVAKAKQKIPHPTNIARLFRATIGQGYAGGLGDKTAELTDSDNSAGDKYYKYYIPGVGTPFPEIEDLDFSLMGLAGATHGEDRINWALLHIIDALMRTMKLNKMDDGACWKSVKNMATSWYLLELEGAHNRYEEFQRLLKGLSGPLKRALMPAEPGKPKLLGIKLYVYGFSRGAAAARAFVKWLSELLPAPEGENTKPEQCLATGDLKIPLSVEFLGLLDTVASVGIPHIAPVSEGHMGWADGNQELPDEEIYGGLIKRCVHLVSTHEQRLCFPLDSIRRTKGKYPAQSVEVVYPGVHSDIGGGYDRGDQGKANGNDDSLLLSQIALHDMYASAFSAGAPLKVPEECLPRDLAKDLWRTMPFDLGEEFVIEAALVNRFNAWRELTLNLPASKEQITDEQAAQYNPPRAPVSLEKAMEEQMCWMTGWRINRYARGTYKTQRFYIDSAKDGRDKDSDPAVRAASKADRAALQKAAEDKRKEEIAASKDGDFQLLTQGPKDFDAALGQTQLRQGAQEFMEDYEDISRTGTEEWYYEPLYGLKNAVFLLNSDDEYGEWRRMRTAGDTGVKVLFPTAGEASNADQPSGLVRTLFDDQVHDSRAWFMHNAFGSREFWGGYFRYRMVYFGDTCNKKMSPLMIGGAVVGAATLIGGVAFVIRQKSIVGKVGGLAGMAGAIALEATAMDLLSGKPLPMLPGAEALQAYTQQPGAVVAQQKVALAEQQLEMAKSAIQSGWLDKVQTMANV